MNFKIAVIAAAVSLVAMDARAHLIFNCSSANGKVKSTSTGVTIVVRPGYGDEKSFTFIDSRLNAPDSEKAEISYDIIHEEGGRMDSTSLRRMTIKKSDANTGDKWADERLTGDGLSALVVCERVTTFDPMPRPRPVQP